MERRSIHRCTKKNDKPQGCQLPYIANDVGYFILFYFIKKKKTDFTVFLLPHNLYHQLL